MSEERLRELDEDGRIWWGEDGNNVPAPKIFLSEVKQGRVPQTLWTWQEVGTTQDSKREIVSILDFDTSGEVFITPKPSSLLLHILRIATDKDSIVLDSFAGSGTTGHAVLALNKEDGGSRRFILVECEEYADAITAERVRRVIKGVPSAKDESLREGLGGTFSYFKLGKPMRKESMLERGKLPSYERLAAYIFFTATGEEFDAAKMRPERHFIGRSRNYDVFLIYTDDFEQLKDMALTMDVARKLSRTKRPKLVFAPTKYLDREFLHQYGITFQQLPFEIYENGGSARPMILKEYQKTALQAVRTFLDLLVEWQQKDEAVRKAVPDAGIDWVGEAWERARTGRRHLARKNGLGEPLPTFCLKIPTGGGKTLLATKVIDLVNTHYRRQQAGLVLWIVPTTQIYNQTLKALKDRDHPYRQQLDVSSRRQDADPGEEHRLQAARRARAALRAAAHAAVRQPRDEGIAADVSGQRRVRQLLPQRGRRHRPGEAARRSAELEHLRVRKRRVGQAGQDVTRQHAASLAAAHHSGRRPQGVQPRRQGDAGRLQPVHDRRTLGHAAQGSQRAGGDHRPGTERRGDDQAGLEHPQQDEHGLARHAAGRHRTPQIFGGQGAGTRSGNRRIHPPHLPGAGGAHWSGATAGGFHSRRGRARILAAGTRRSAPNKWR